MDKKQTSVEWLVEYLKKHCEYNIEGTGFVERALEMEKQQIMKAYHDGNGFPANETQQKKYYNETFKK